MNYPAYRFPWGSFPTDVTSPMPTQMPGPEPTPTGQRTENDNSPTDQEPKATKK